MGNNFNNLAAGLALVGSMFGGNNQDSNTFGAPVDNLKKTGQSEASNAEQNLALQNKYAEQAGQNNLTLGTLAKQLGGAIDLSDYEQKRNIDSATATTSLHNQLSEQRQASDRASNYVDYSPRVEQQTPQIAAADQNYYDRLKTGQQASIQSAFAAQNFANQQMTADQNYRNSMSLQADQLASQQKIAQLQAQSQLGAAALGAQGNIASSLFGSLRVPQISGNDVNGRYWS